MVAGQSSGARRSRPRSVCSILIWCVPAALVAAAAYELAFMLWGSYSGLEPGQSPSGRTLAELIAMVAMVAAFVVAIAGITRPVLRPVLAILAPAAAAFVLARFFTYDPYYFPTLHRYSDGGILPLGWVLLVTGMGLLAGVTARLRPRAGSPATIVVLLLLLFNFVWMGTGH
jgi:hypothetical protein